MFANKVESLSLKKCGINIEIFKDLSKAILPQLKVLELDSNKFGNDGLKIIRNLLVVQVNSQLERLSLYDCEF